MNGNVPTRIQPQDDDILDRLVRNRKIGNDVDASSYMLFPKHSELAQALLTSTHFPDALVTWCGGDGDSDGHYGDGDAV